jgi:LysR family transcriptional regulator of gallate degradation
MVDDTASAGMEAALPYLRAFLAVATLGSVAKSSTVLFRAPSAVVRAIGELEGVLGVCLFERKPRGMLRNAYGNALLLRARRIEEEVGLAAEEFCRIGKAAGAAERNAVGNLLFNGRKLLLFVNLAEHRQVSAVARQFGMSQAGVSMFLSRLEEALGQTLFHRMAQGLAATDPAAALLLGAKRVLAELRHLEADLSAMRGSLRGTVTIGALPLCRTLILPAAIAAALAAHPQLRIRTFESPYDVLANGLRSGDIDFILGALRPPELCQGVKNEPLFTDRIALVARKEHPLARRRGVSLADLRDSQWILPRPDTPSRKSLEVNFRDAGMEPPQPSVETGDLAILRMLLARSDMLTAISPQQLLVEIEAGTLAELPVPLTVRERRIGLVLREGARLSPAAEAVLQEIRTSVRNLEASPRPELLTAMER